MKRGSVKTHQIVQLCCLREVQLLLQARHALHTASWRLILRAAGAAALRGPARAEAAAWRAPSFTVEHARGLAARCVARMGVHTT